METREISACMGNGSITYPDRDDQAADIQWNEHPKFKGVFLKHLIKGVDTSGLLSCHLVQIGPNAVLEEHIHEDQWELHEVIEGEGSFILGTKDTPYHPGRMGVIPKGTTHKVIAGKNGLVLLAKFFPALL
jgi:mannose-6-phosphate isomerase-like protein (cupin superfamily)